MLFADFLNWAMDQTGVSNYKLAKDLDISQTTIANWLSGFTEPRPKVRARVLDLFSVDEQDLEIGFPDVQYKQKNPPTPASEGLTERTDYAKLNADNRKIVDDLIASLLKSQSGGQQ